MTRRLTKAEADLVQQALIDPAGPETWGRDRARSQTWRELEVAGDRWLRGINGDAVARRRRREWGQAGVLRRNWWRIRHFRWTPKF